MEYEDPFGKLSTLTQFGSLSSPHHMFDEFCNMIISVREPTARSFKADSNITIQEETFDISKEKQTNEGDLTNAETINNIKVLVVRELGLVTRCIESRSLE